MQVIFSFEFQLNVGSDMSIQPELQCNSTTPSNGQRVSPENGFDPDRISEMRKLVHELDNNLSISSQQSSFSSDEQKCDACIHTQHIIPTEW